MRAPVRATLLTLAVLGAQAGCGSVGSAGPESSGRRRQAVEELRRYGLDKATAECIADRLGPEVVVEATDLGALAAGRPYQDAAKACRAGGQ